MSICTGIELNDQFSNTIYSIINAVNLACSSMAEMQATMNTEVDTSMMNGAIEQINQATMAMNDFNEMLANNATPSVPTDTPSIPTQWESNELEVFTNTGIDRFQQEIQSANQMLMNLNETQNQIQQTAGTIDILPDNAMTDINNMGQRLQMIQQRIQQIESNPLNVGMDGTNAELEQLRAQLSSAIQQQNELNTAMQNADISVANAAYMRLSQTVSNTERYIRDNVDEQGRFNSAIQQGANNASNLNSMISKAVGAFAGIFGIRKVISFVSGSMDAFNTQLNAETQLMSVLANTLNDDYVADYMIETQMEINTSGAIDKINSLSNDINTVEITVEARTEALQAEFDAITAKASEIQAKGIYGDEAMIAGAAELSTYFTDTKAIEMMMDTLSDYAMGMSGGGEIDSTAMVNYATGLGKVMTGAYDAMTKKGFEFTDIQKAIIEGTATQEQIVAAIGEEYLDMSSDMQAAAAISQVIDESWAGLYETMSDTPQGKIIQMKNTWGDMREVIAEQLYPYIVRLVDTISSNWPTIESITRGFVSVLSSVLTIIGFIIEAAFGFASVVADNWPTLEPIIWGLVIALVAYNIAQGISNGLKAVAAIREKVHAASLMLESGETFKATAAQYGFNAALLACPLTWIIAAIIAVIVAIYAVVAAINKITGSTYSATGIICGILGVAFAFIGNGYKTIWNIAAEIITDLYNAFAGFANFFGNLFNDPVAAIVKLVIDMGDAILGVVEGALEALSWITFGLADYTDDIKRIRSNMNNWFEENYGDRYTEYVEKIDPNFLKIDEISYSAAWDAGYAFGENIDDMISRFNPSDMFNETYGPNPEDYVSHFNNLDNIAEDTSKISDSLEISEENLKYLRDIAEQDAINKFTTAEIYIDQSGMKNTINSDTDLDGVVSGLTDAVNEAVNIITEGVHT